MAKIRQQEGRPADALPHIQETVTMFRDTGSRHMAEAEQTLQEIQQRMQATIEPKKEKYGRANLATRGVYRVNRTR